MNYTVQELARQYAEKLVVYHTVRLTDDKKGTRAAYNDLLLAQNLLDSAAIRAAELTLGLNNPYGSQDIGCEFDEKLV